MLYLYALPEGNPIIRMLKNHFL